MINTILIVIYIALAVIFTGVFCLYGLKKGLISGIFVLGTGIASAVLSYMIAPAISPAVCEIPFIADLHKNVVTATNDIGVYSDSLGNTIDETFVKIVELPLAVILFIVIFVLLSVASMIIKKCAKLTKNVVSKKSKIQGMIVSGIMPVAVLLFTVIFAKIDLFAETKTIDEIMSLTSKNEKEIVIEICSDTQKYSDIYFDTTLIAADENTRLEIANKAVASVINNTDDDILTEVYDFEGYKSRDELSGELNNLAELYNTLSSEVDLFSDGALIEKLYGMKNIEEPVNKLYQLKLRDTVLRYALSKSVCTVLDKDDYIYPDSVDFDGTEKDVVALICIVKDLSDGKISKLSAAAELAKSPLITSDILKELVEMGVSTLDKRIQKYIDDSDIIDKIVNGSIDAEKLSAIIEKVENGKLLEEITKLEQLPAIDENEVRDFIDEINEEQLPEGINKSDVENIINGDYSSLINNGEIPDISDIDEISDLINNYLNR